MSRMELNRKEKKTKKRTDKGRHRRRRRPINKGPSLAERLPWNARFGGCSIHGLLEKEVKRLLLRYSYSFILQESSPHLAYAISIASSSVLDYEVVVFVPFFMILGYHTEIGATNLKRACLNYSKLHL